jgi:hypothetical protein
LQHLNHFLFHNLASQSRAHLEMPSLFITCALSKKALDRAPRPRAGAIKRVASAVGEEAMTVAFVHEFLRTL